MVALWLKCVLMVGTAAMLAASQTSGIVTVLSESLFERDAREMFSDLEKELVAKTDHGTVKGKNGRFSWKLYRINIYHFSGPSANVEMGTSANDPTMSYELEGATIKAAFQWEGSYDAWFTDVKVDGSADARLYGVDLSKSVKLRVTKDDHLELDSTNCGLSSCCDLQIDDMSISLRGGAVAWVMDKVISLFYGAIADIIKYEACEKLNRLIHDEMNPQLASIPLRSTLLSEGLNLHYNLTDISHSGDCIVIGMDGGVTSVNQTISPIMPPALPVSVIDECVEDGFDFSIKISRSTIQSLVSALHASGRFTNFSLKQEQILRAGPMFRPGFFARSEDELMQHYILKAHVNITSPPRISINQTQQCIEIEIPTSMDLVLQHPNEGRGKRFLLNVEAEFSMGLQLHLSQDEGDTRLKGVITKNSWSVDGIVSSLETKDFELTSAQTMLDIVAKGLLKPLVEEYMERGVPTDFGRVFTVQTSDFKYRQDYVEIDGMLNDWEW